MRVSKPPGNAVKGKFNKAQDLRRSLRRELQSHIKRETDLLLGFNRDFEVATEEYNKKGRVPVLYPYRNKVKILRATFKGKKVRARVLRDGRIRYNNELFTSPSRAAARAVGRSAENGWFFWKYERAPGDWVVLSKLRK